MHSRQNVTCAVLDPRITKKGGNWGSEARWASLSKPAEAHSQRKPLCLDLNPGGQIPRPLKFPEPLRPTVLHCPVSRKKNDPLRPATIPFSGRLPVKHRRMTNSRSTPCLLWGPGEKGRCGGLTPPARLLTIFLEAGFEGGESEVVSELRRMTSGQLLSLQGQVPPASPQKWEGGDQTESTSPPAALARNPVKCLSSLTNKLVTYTLPPLAPQAFNRLVPKR